MRSSRRSIRPPRSTRATWSPPAASAIRASTRASPWGGCTRALEQRNASPILYWIANLYVILIVLVVGGMGLHNLLDFLKKIRRELAVQKGLIQEEPVPHRLYLRMTVNQRLQHAGLAISFALLVITGFMLRYPEAWWVVAIRHVSDHAFLLRGLIHRIAGVALIGAGLWHIGYLALTAEGRQLFRDLLAAQARSDRPVGGPAVQPRPGEGQAAIRPVQLHREGGILGADLGHGADGRHRRHPLV